MSDTPKPKALARVRTRSVALIAALLCCESHAASQLAGQAPAAPSGSAYEQHWGRACGERATLGKLDPPPGRRFTLVVAADADRSRTEYAHLDPNTARRLSAALFPRVAAFRECFSGLRYEAWVELAPSKPEAPMATAELPRAAVTCASALLRTVLAGADPDGVEFVGVRLDYPAGPPPSEQGGGLSKTQIRGVIQLHMGEVRACYEQALRVWPKLFGRVDTRFVITADGQVALVEATASSVNQPALECCITSAVKRWRFDRPVDGGIVVVRYPFILKQVSAL
jgi:hypothetical protein